MVSDSLDFAATFLAADVFGQWLIALFAVLLARRIILYLRKNLT